MQVPLEDMKASYSTADLVNKETVLTLSEQADIVAIDTETTGLDIRDGRDKALGLSMAVRSKTGALYAAYYPINHRTPDGGPDPLNISADEFKRLEKCIERIPRVIFHNAKFDIVSLSTIGIEIKNEYADTMLLAHLINENYPVSKGLDSCCKAYLGGYGKEKSDLLDVFIKNFGWHAVPAWVMDRYAEVDAKVTLELFEALIKKVDFF